MSRGSGGAGAACRGSGGEVRAAGGCARVCAAALGRGASCRVPCRQSAIPGLSSVDVVVGDVGGAARGDDDANDGEEHGETRGR